MTWLRLDDRFDEHPKIEALSAKAFQAHVRALCYAARNETDGVLVAGVARRLAPGRVLAELTRDVWHREPDGSFRIHDYLDFNPSRAELDEKRAATARRTREWRERNDASDADEPAA